MFVSHMLHLLSDMFHNRRFIPSYPIKKPKKCVQVTKSKIFVTIEIVGKK